MQSVDASLMRQLRCYHLPARGKYCDPALGAFYNGAYQFWRETLIEGLLSEGREQDAKTLTGDSFLRQEELVCLFSQDKAIALFMFDWIDISYEANLDYSYFKNYPVEVLNALKKNSHNLIMTMGQMAVHPSWRKRVVGPGISDILLSFAVKRFLETRATALITYTRNNRKTNELVSRHGGITLLGNHTAYGIASDILMIDRSTAHLSPIEGVAESVEQLWQTKANGIKEKDRQGDHQHEA